MGASAQLRFPKEKYRLTWDQLPPIFPAMNRFMEILTRSQVGRADVGAEPLSPQLRPAQPL